MIKTEPLSKSKQTQVRKLGRRKYRDQAQRFIAEGRRVVEEFASVPETPVDYVIIEATSLENGQFDAFLHEIILQTEIPVFTLDRPTFNELSDVEHSQGIIAVVQRPPAPSLKDIARSEGLLIVTDGIQDPGNMGTIIRSGVWFGATALLSGKGTVDPFNPKVVRSSMGALGALPIIDVNLPTDLTDHFSDWQILSLMLNEDAVPLDTFGNRSTRTMFVVGNEGNGINPKHLPDQKTMHTPVYIRSISSAEDAGAESLNAGVAASVALYHLTQIAQSKSSL